MRAMLVAAAATLVCACAAVPPSAPGAPIGHPAALAGTNWRVTAVNGGPTPATSDYFLRFEQDRIGAKFGCNGMGGSYAVVNGLLQVGNLTSTLIGCPEPSATFEQQGAAVLGQPMQVTAPGPDTRLLTSSAGTITLVRA